MSQRLGMAEFFAMEAAEYLERLDALVSAPGMPSGDEFQRLSRALRGAALMANQQPIAQASGALEQVARAVRDGTRSWDEATRQLAIRAVDDLKIFVRQVRYWTESDSRKARDLAAALEAIAGRPARPSRATASGPDSGTRAFVAREGAAVASALDRTAKALEHQPASADLMQSILDVMQPLRGLASLADLPPMADLLEAVEWAVAEASTTAASPHASAVFEAAAQALSQSTRQIASAGQADPEAEPVTRFASLLGKMLQLDRPVRAIESLFYDDGGPQIVERGTPPIAPARMGAVDLVSHGEHLRQVADALDAAGTRAQRAFRVYALAETLRALERGDDGPVVAAAAEFALAVRNAIGSGQALDDPATLTARLREAALVLSAAAQGPADDVARTLQGITARLAQPAVPPQPDLPDISAFAPDEPRTALEPELPDIGAFAPDEPVTAPEPAPVRTAPPPAAVDVAPDTGDERPGLAGSLVRYRRYVAALGLDGGSLDELLAGPPADPALTAVAAAEPAPIEEPVAITTLCYAGTAALNRALSLQDRVRDTLAAGDDATELIEEVFDLVKLSLTAD